MKMSDNIPFDTQVEIIKRLPLKSLIRFRSVSKQWKFLIDSSNFIANYNVSHSQPNRLLISYRSRVDSELLCVSVDDDDTFPQRKFSVNVPMFFKLIKNLLILGSSHGLLCLYGYYDKVDESSSNPRSGIAVIWNPSIRKTVVIRVPDESVDTRSPYETVVGFGVCPGSNDLKLVKINFIGSCRNFESISCIPFQVEVFTLSSRAWRAPFRNLPRKSIQFYRSHIVIDGFIYWMAFNGGGGGGDVVDDFRTYQFIISFDLTSEEFTEIHLPAYLAKQCMGTLSISKLRGSLVVLGCCLLSYDQNLYFGVWMMESGVQNSFTKLFTVDVSDECLNKLSRYDGDIYYVACMKERGVRNPFTKLFTVYVSDERINTILGFRENGEPFLEMFQENYSTSLEVYEPSSKVTKDLGIDGEVDSFFVSSYMETLLLLDQQDGSVYFNM